MKASKNGNFAALYFTNYWGVLNDNFLKTLACFVSISWVEPEMQGVVVSAAAGCLVLPYIFLSPLAANLAIRHGNVRVVRICKWAEPAIMAIAIAGLAFESLWTLLLSVLLMGTQSALYSPAKYGLIRDIGGRERVSTGMGGMEAVAFFGMLSGMVAASFMADATNPYIIYIMLAAFSALGLAGSYAIRTNEQADGEACSSNPVTFLSEARRRLDKGENLNRVVMALSMFWWLAATLQMGLIVYCQRELGIDKFTTGMILSLTAVGITAGCIAAGFADKRRSMLSHTPFFALLVSIMCLVMYFADLSAPAFAACIFLTAFIAAFYKIPLDAEIQKSLKGGDLNVGLAYFNQVSFIFMLLASATYALSSLISPRAMFLMLSIAMLLCSFYVFVSLRKVICGMFKRALDLRYDIRVSGEEHFRSGRTLLVLPNHQAVVDPMIMFSYFSDYRLRPLVDESYFNLAVSRRVLALFDAVVVPNLSRHRNAGAVEQIKSLHGITIENLKAGQNIIFYPSGHITKTGTEQIGSRSLAYDTVRDLPEGVDICMVRIKGLWGSMWSRKGKSKTPQFAAGLVKSILKIISGWVFFHKKRRVDIEIFEMTSEVKQWASEGDKMAFNKKLEEFYNYEGLGVRG